MNKPLEDSPLAYPLMAMVQHQLGHDREAREQLAKAKAKFNEHRGQNPPAKAFLEPDRFEYELLYREADSMIATRSENRLP